MTRLERDERARADFRDELNRGRVKEAARQAAARFVPALPPVNAAAATLRERAASLRAKADAERAEALARADFRDDDESRILFSSMVGRPLTPDEQESNRDIRRRNPDVWQKAFDANRYPPVVVERLSFRNTKEQSAVIAKHLAEGYVLQQQSERTSRWTAGGVMTLTFVRPTP